MGAKLARPDKTAVAFMGNAALDTVGMDFETAVRQHIPIMVVLVNNSVFGGYAEKVENLNDIVPDLKRAKKAADSGQAALLEIITCEETPKSVYR